MTAATLVDAGAPRSRRPAASVARIAADPDERLLVALIDDQVVGAMHLTRGPLSPIHGETAVYVMHLQVLEDVPPPRRGPRAASRPR